MIAQSQVKSGLHCTSTAGICTGAQPLD